MSVIEVAIGRGTSPGTCTVQIVHSPAGEASETVPLDVESLLRRRESLQHALLASAVRSRRLVPESERPLRDVGHQLFTALLGTGQVAGCYRASAALADERGERLRVVMRMSDPVLAGLPWESMYDQVLGSYVCRKEPLVRNVPVARMPAPLTVAPPLRILGIVSAPRDLPALDVTQEREQLAQALARPIADGRVCIDWAPEATWSRLQDQLLSDTWHVVHFIGHGDFDPHRDEGVLALVGEDGRTHQTGAERFVELLQQARPMPRLVVLNSCSGAAGSQGDLFSGTAAALVRGGVTAVVAMQYEVSDHAAIAFTRGFYTAVVHGRGVDDAVSSGRTAILGLNDRTLEWVTPVLYLRGSQSHLFSIPPTGGSGGTKRDDGRNRTTPSSQADDTGSGAPAPSRADRAVKQPSPRTPRRPRTTRKAREPSAAGPCTVLRALPREGSPMPWRAVTAVAFSPDGRLLASAHSDRLIRLWDPATGEELRAVRGHTQSAEAVAFIADGHLLASASRDTSIRVSDSASGQTLRTLTGHTRPVYAIGASTDGHLLASGGGDGTVRIWDPATGTVLHTLHTSMFDAVLGVAFGPGGRMLAAGGSDRTLRTWDPFTGEKLRTFQGHVGCVRAVAFSPDGHQIACADEYAVRIWDVEGGEELYALTGHDGWVADVAFSPDGRLLASASHDKTVRIWDPSTGRAIRTLTGHQNVVFAVAFSPDGRLLASAGYDRTIRLWE